MTRRYLAFDLGAESGRAIAARLDGERLTVREVARFANQPLRSNGALNWDVRRLWREMTQALDRSEERFDSVGVDSWGVDYALVGESGTLVEDPYHYRDARTDGVMAEVVARAGRERIYSTTGIQFLPINTLYQFVAACRRAPKIIEAAAALLTIPDLFNYWLTGALGCEYTNATTTQMVDATTRNWAMPLLHDLGLPTRLLQAIVRPGTIVGAVQPSASDAAAGTVVVAPGCHDTASAVASVRAGGPVAFLSSGTWSLIGTEVAAPLLTARARDLNFTNEGGVCDTIRLLKNVSGLWLLQACRRAWAAHGRVESYDELASAAAASPSAFASLVDPDHARFLNPADMPSAIGDYCRQTGQPAPATRGAVTRAIFESLAMKYRLVLDSLEDLTGQPIREVRVIGGGARNRVLNQFTADATGRRVSAGPVEATALGNVALQAVATGGAASLADARAIIERSFPPDRFEPRATEQWEAPYRRFLDYVELTCA